MRFRIVNSISTLPNSVLIYRPYEFSFDTDPSPMRSFTSILIDDLNIGVTSLGKAISVWGLCPHTRWKEKALQVPPAESGDLFVTNVDLKDGVSFSVTSSNSFLPVYFDREVGWIEIRSKGALSKTVMIMPGVIFEISDEGEFCALWLHPVSGIIELSDGRIYGDSALN